MKNYLLLTLFALTFGFKAQLKLIDPGKAGVNLNNAQITVSGVPADNDLEFALSVINTSTQTYNLKCRRKEVNVISGTTNTTCWVLCPPYLNAGDYPILVIGQNGVEYTESIAAGATVGFLAHYGPHNTVGSSLFSYEWFDESDPNTILAKIDCLFDHSVVSIKGNKKALEFSLYPNPSNDYVYLKSDIKIGGAIVVIDLLGKTVLSVLDTANGRIDTSSLVNGVYFVSVLMDNKIINTQKLVVKH